MKQKVGCIIQARFNSKRFPGKILMPLSNKSVLQFQLERLKKLKNINSLIVATTTNKKDDQIKKIVTNQKIKIYRGDENNFINVQN